MNAYSRANRRIYAALSDPLSATHRHRLDDLLKRHDNGKTTWLAWLRQSPVKPNSRHILEHIERLKAWQALDLPPASSGRCTRTACSRSPAKAAR
ncbi:transposase Tn3 family protein [Pseudomonas aeruginosa]|nr:transposase Tn3 family protein [Pseudomonas aeruginosa]